MLCLFHVKQFGRGAIAARQRVHRGAIALVRPTGALPIVVLQGSVRQGQGELGAVMPYTYVSRETSRSSIRAERGQFTEMLEASRPSQDRGWTTTVKTLSSSRRLNPVSASMHGCFT